MGTLMIYWRDVLARNTASWMGDAMRQVPTAGEWAAFHRQLQKHRS